MYTAALTTAILAGLTAAAPLAQGTVTIQVGLGLGGDDSSSVREVPFGKLTAGVLPAASRLVVNSGINVPISQDQIICQAFSDDAGIVPLGPSFNDVLPGIKLGDGTSLVNVGSVFCSDAASVAAFTAGSAAPPPSSGLTAVNIKLDFGNSEGASVGTVPVNGQLVPTKGIFATSVAFKAAIQTANAQGVTCTAFGDAAGQQKLADVLGDGKDVFFNQAHTDVPIGAFKCAAH